MERVKRECQLCGTADADVRTGLACYADDGRFERIDRCIAHQDCRERVESQGESWPLIDVTDRANPLDRIWQAR